LQIEGCICPQSRQHLGPQRLKYDPEKWKRRT
jgi:hypothetical protein